MGSIVFTKSTEAICLLLVTVFVLAVANIGPYFTSVPKDKEVFVGRSVQFDWEYMRSDIKEVRFGVQVNGTEVAIVKVVLKNDGTKTVKLNNKMEEVKGTTERVEVVSDRRASFRIKNVRMSDTGIYFCSLDYLKIKFVKLTVVDLLIDQLSSSVSVESWEGHRIQVTCAVKVPADINAKFSWIHIPSNTTVAKQHHDELGSKSHLTITTYKDQDFEALQCRAETKSTVKFHIVNITRLSAPSQPRNLKSRRIFDRGIAQAYFQLRWEPPENNGGSVISKYIIHYVPKGLPWKDARIETTENNQNEYNLMKLENGEIYNVVVRARNKAGVGPSSNEIELNLEDPMMQPRSAGTLHHYLDSCVLSVFLVFWIL